jgi:hypothetical protein
VDLLQTPVSYELTAMRLAGGEALLSSAAFQLTARGDAGDRRSWVVHHVDRQEKRTEIAEFKLDGGRLSFRWHPNCELREADQLRNALLEVTFGQHNAMLPLRAATTVDPLPLAGARGAGHIEARVDALPETSRLRLELTRSVGQASFANRFENKIVHMGEQIAVDLGAGDRGFPLQVHITFDAPRAGARVIHIRYELRYLSQLQPREKENWSRSNISRDLAYARRMLQQRSGVADQQQRDQLLRIIDYYTQLEALARSASSLDLHYRILLPIEDTQMVLATSDAQE